MGMAIKVRHWEDINRVYDDVGLVCSAVHPALQNGYLIVFYDYNDINKEKYREFMDRGINTAAELFSPFDYIAKHNEGWVL